MISSFALVLPLFAAGVCTALDHRVVVGGPNLLAYTPPTVSAAVGDTITFEFHEKNHTVTQAAFDSPCSPLSYGFDSGFMPVAPGTTWDFPTYTITVKDDKPIWAYCRQPGPPAHCPSGMVFAANAPSTGNTFDAFRAKALALNQTSTTTHDSASHTSTASPPAGSSKDHRVVVGGPNLLAYTPPTVSAAVGDTITFEFHEKNHTVTQAAFDSPCSPLSYGFDSGFMPVAPGTTWDFPTYTITVKDDKPIWAYCRQPGPPAHCPSGMVFAANAPSTGNTFDAFRAKALALNQTSGRPYGSGSKSYSSGYGSATEPYSSGYAAATEPYSSGYGAATEPYSSGYDRPYTSGGSYASAPPAESTVTVTTTVTEQGSSCAGAAASPTYTNAAAPAVHTIVVGGSAGLVYTPDTVVAAVGDIVEFQFRAKNHTATRSPFGSPCTDLGAAQGGFDSGFMPVAPNATTFPTYRVRVNDTKPIWGHCRQQGHCQQGMVFGINPPTSGPNTFAAFEQLALHSNATLTAPSAKPTY